MQEDVLPGLDLFSAGQTEDCSIHVDRQARFAVVTTDDGMVLAYVTAEPDLGTAEGIAVGASTVDDLVATYGADSLADLDTVSKQGGPMVLHSPDRGAPRDGDTVMVFETRADRSLTEIRAGLWPWAAMADYCQDRNPRAANIGWPLE
ncbi:hypothetical protein [Nakamurella deserti]|uniref:hypothetical protein n=1 Tax=Nakamurella deserti TaxID=2164074 RepID=UPI00130043D9|nr:hypothetical protein [Nakamurella deserti]